DRCKRGNEPRRRIDLPRLKPADGQGARHPTRLDYLGKDAVRAKPFPKLLGIQPELHLLGRRRKRIEMDHLEAASFVEFALQDRSLKVGVSLNETSWISFNVAWLTPAPVSDIH